MRLVWHDDWLFVSDPRIAVWVLPGPDGEPVEYRTPYAEAVAEQRATALRVAGCVYASDDDAFEDFVAMSWAVVLPAADTRVPEG